MKFFNLLKKELAELLNVQTIISLVVAMSLLMLMGNVMTNTIEEAVKQEYTVTLCDRDKTDFTADMLETLRGYGAKINEVTDASEDYAKLLDNSGKESLVIIPEGFSEAVEKGEAPQLISIARMKSAAMMSNMSNTNSGAESLIKKAISDVFSQQAGLSPEDVTLINNPVKINSHTVISDKSAEVSTDMVMSKVMMQNMILPVIVFVLIMMTSQGLMSGISNEKIDKTLETLLSAPVSRTAILGSKMLAATIVAMLQAVLFMVGFSSMMSGATEGATADIANTIAAEIMPLDQALDKLGLTLGVGDYILVGIQLFLTIMICLCLSLVLGSLVNDAKQTQTMIMPLMFGAMIPYMISMLADINTLPIAVRIFVYAIPFTHTFSAIPNLMFDNMTIFLIGLAYQTVVFAVCMFFALRLFKSDKILTTSLNFGQKSKYKKATKSED
ncbi:MAG: ABC transporter permease [Ruminococcus sp.]|jgi:ABC-2 type transport system permease protein|nr:ABC transporter permease [Ruminococcus sp.]